MRDNIYIMCAPSNHMNTSGTEEKCCVCNCDVFLTDSSIDKIRDVHSQEIKREHVISICIECGLAKAKESNVEIQITGMGAVPIEDDHCSNTKDDSDYIFPNKV